MGLLTSEGASKASRVWGLGRGIARTSPTDCRGSDSDGTSSASTGSVAEPQPQ